MDNNKTQMHKNIMEQIATRQLRPRPRLYFMLKVAALVGVAFFVLVFSVSICSYILFTIRASTATSLVHYGPPGWLIFIEFFPWSLFVLDVLLILLLEWMLRQFRFGYRSPVLYLLFGIFVLVSSASIVVDQTRLSDRMLMRAHDTRVPGFEGLYDHGRRPPPHPPQWQQP